MWRSIPKLAVCAQLIPQLAIGAQFILCSIHSVLNSCSCPSVLCIKLSTSTGCESGLINQLALMLTRLNAVSHCRDLDLSNLVGIIAVATCYEQNPVFRRKKSLPDIAGRYVEYAPNLTGGS